MVQNKFSYYKTLEGLKADIAAGNISSKSIVFVEDERMLYTHDQWWRCTIKTSLEPEPENANNEALTFYDADGNEQGSVVINSFNKTFYLKKGDKIVSADFNVKMSIRAVETTLPDTSKYEEGDMIAVGEEEPYTIYSLSNGEWVNLGPLGVANVNVVQSRGTSTADVMSQKAVTDLFDSYDTTMANLESRVNNTMNNKINEVNTSLASTKTELKAEMNTLKETIEGEMDTLENDMNSELTIIKNEVFPLKATFNVNPLLIEADGNAHTINLSWNVKRSTTDVTASATNTINGTTVTGTSKTESIVTNISQNSTTNTTYTFASSYQGISTNVSKTVKAVHISYFGVVNSDFVLTDQTKNILSTTLNETRAYTKNNISLTNQKICFAYPAYFGDLTSIVDGNGYEVLNSYDMTKVTLNGVQYNCYLLRMEVSQTDVTQIYK